MFFNKKNRDGIELTERAKGQAAELEVTIDITISRKGDEGYGSGSNAQVGKVNLTKILLSNTDAHIKDIEKEVSGVLEGSVEDLFGQVRISRHLSDGFIAEEKTRLNP